MVAVAVRALTDEPWNAGRVRHAITAIVADADAAFDAAALWPAHEWDGRGSHLPLKDLYVGAAAVIWALDALRRRGHASTSLDLAAAALRTLELFRDEPDADRDEHYHPAALLLGETGPLLVACRVAAGAPHADDLYALLPTSVANPTDDIMWGVPGALLARALRAGGPRSPRTRTLLSGAGETAADNSCSGDSGSAATRRRCVD